MGSVRLTLKAHMTSSFSIDGRWEGRLRCRSKKHYSKSYARGHRNEQDNNIIRVAKLVKTRQGLFLILSCTTIFVNFSICFPSSARAEEPACPVPALARIRFIKWAHLPLVIGRKSSCFWGTSLSWRQAANPPQPLKDNNKRKWRQ